MSKSSFSWLAFILLAVSVCTVLPSRGQNRGQNQAQCNCRRETARPLFKLPAAFATQ